MNIFNFFDSDDRSCWTDKIKECDWKAAKFLADLIERKRFDKMLGGGKLFIMEDNGSLVSFVTLTKKDCIDTEDIFPWLGFVFTAPEYRGHRYSGEIISYACEEAKKQGYDKVYLATDHIGLYEKYGFSYMESRMDIYGEESRIYCKNI